MIVLEDRVNQRLTVRPRRRALRGRRTSRIGIEAIACFPNPPAVVATRFDDIDLFETILADIAGKQSPGLRVEREPPRIAEPERVDLRHCVLLVDERIVAWNQVV
jgi:hypothetical protein